jgi:hypothetical protein
MSADSGSERMTVAGAYQKIEAHEDLCAERYRGIRDSLAELRDGQKGHNRAAWAIAITIAGWMAIQLYQLEPARQAPAVSMSVTR